MMDTAQGIGKGLSLNKLLVIAHFFLLLSAIAAALVLARVDNVADASLSELSTAVLFEAISWGAYPIIAFVLLLAFRMTAQRWTLFLLTIGAALLSEFPHDLAFSGQWVDMAQQSPMWALPLCVLIAMVWFSSEDLSTGQKAWRRGGILLISALWILLLNIGLKLGLVYLGFVIVAFFVLFLALWGRENTMMLTAGLLGAGMIVTPAVGVIFLHYRAPLIEEKGSVPSPLWLVVYPVILFIAALVGLIF